MPIITPKPASFGAGRIGSWDGVRWFHGRLGEIRFYSRPLSSAEISIVMEASE